MDNVSAEFWYIVFVVVFMLVQFLRDLFRKGAAKRAGGGEQEAAEEADEEDRGDEAAAAAPFQTVSYPEAATVTPHLPHVAVAPAPTIPARRAPPAARRFSRQALLGDKRRMQDGVAIATILGPCRADEPYGKGPS